LAQPPRRSISQSRIGSLKIAAIVAIKPKTCELTGGTGKFQGLQASIIITSMPVKSTYEGTLQIVGRKNGTYKIVKTN
jgi:hypothetical protein